MGREGHFRSVRFSGRVEDFGLYLKAVRNFIFMVNIVYHENKRNQGKNVLNFF